MTMIRPALHEYRTWTVDSRRWQPYRPRSDDIIIATASKCGTTWMQQIISLLVFQDAAPRSLAAVSPWIDARFRGSLADLYLALSNQRHRRFLKSHLPVDGLPLYDEVRYIHVARDGRDALMSMHNHFLGLSASQLAILDRIGVDDPNIGRPFPRLPTDPAEYFRKWICIPAVVGQTEGTPDPSYFDLHASYWQVRNRTNVLLVHYNDLLCDLDAEMRRVARFIDVVVDEGVWSHLVGAACFQAMRDAGELLMPHAGTLFPEGARRFFFKGTNGRWRGVLTDDDLALYQAKARMKFPTALACWLERGRCAVGDPREVAD
jgi:aryl sulfotransferase